MLKGKNQELWGYLSILSFAQRENMSSSLSTRKQKPREEILDMPARISYTDNFWAYYIASPVSQKGP